MTAREGGGCGEAEVDHPREYQLRSRWGKRLVAEEACKPGSERYRGIRGWQWWAQWLGERVEDGVSKQGKL